MKKTIIILLAALLLLLSSCTNSVKAPDDSWENIFLQYWNMMNTEFVHFSDDRSYDWDAVYEEYLPRFQALDWTDKEDSVKAFAYFREIAVNAYDNHYNLTVTDAFGQKLVCSPAMLKKFAAAGGDINDYPDIVLINKYDVAYVTAVGNDGFAYDSDDILERKVKAIPSYNEVEDLKGDGTTSLSYFHSPDGDINTEFPDDAYYGAEFSLITDKVLETLPEEDKKIAAKWNLVLTSLDMSSYFFGVNKDNIFYVYFSDFGNPLFLYDIMIKDESELTPDDKEALTNVSVLLIRTMVQDVIKAVNDGTVTDAGLQTTLKDGIQGLAGLVKMYEVLHSVVKDDKWEVSSTVTKENIKGVIVDIRGNGGGAVSFLEAFWGTFFTGETQFGYVRYKSGYSRLEYTPWTSFSIDKDFANEDLKETYKKPVALVVNGYSVSCSEISCVISKLLPSSAVVGHTTFGGTCGLTDRKIYNGGSFTAEHLSVYTTTYQFVDNNMESFEMKGITPDVESALLDNTDDAYVKAVEWVKSHTV